MDRYKRISINDSNLVGHDGAATRASPRQHARARARDHARRINRNESRGAHFKPEFPDRDDENFLKTTIAEYSGEGPVFSYTPVDISLLQPRKARLQQRKERNSKGLIIRANHTEDSRDTHSPPQRSGLAAVLGSV
jgi:succinate dehydrogenase / fumarate reductase flavoprotein subunit